MLFALSLYVPDVHAESVRRVFACMSLCLLSRQGISGNTVAAGRKALTEVKTTAKNDLFKAVVIDSSEIVDTNHKLGTIPRSWLVAFVQIVHPTTFDVRVPAARKYVKAGQKRRDAPYQTDEPGDATRALQTADREGATPAQVMTSFEIKTLGIPRPGQAVKGLFLTIHRVDGQRGLVMDDDEGIPDLIISIVRN